MVSCCIENIYQENTDSIMINYMGENLYYVFLLLADHSLEVWRTPSLAFTQDMAPPPQAVAVH